MNYKRRLYPAEEIRDTRELLRRAKELYGDKAAFRQIIDKKNEWSVSFSGLWDDVNAFGTGLYDLGLQDKHIAVIGENSIEWVVSYMAIVGGLGVAIPMDKELDPHTIAIQLNKSDCEAVICSGKYAKKVTTALEECPQIQTKIIMRGKTGVEYEGFIPYEAIQVNGRKLWKSGDYSYTSLQIDPEKMCEIIFTSGTTGANKGVMLSQKNNMAVLYGAMRLIYADPNGNCFSVLPINHSYEKNTNIMGALYSGVTICFNDDLKHVLQNLKRFAPTTTIMVPMFLESIIRKIKVEVQKNHLENHLKYGVWFSNFLLRFGIDKRRKYFAPILENFGGNLNQIVCGGAPLNDEIIRTLDSYGLNIINGYGITECAPLVAANCTRFKKIGSVGMIMPGVEVRIANPDSMGNGEIQVKGDNVMLGYYKDEENTKATFTEDGWLKTGDLGHLDKDNFLYIAGRLKNLIILANGKNVYPEEIEDMMLSHIPYLNETIVYADDEGTGIYAACYLDPEYLEANGIDDPKAHLMKDISAFNAKMPSYKRIVDCYLSEQEFEKTTTKKIKRFTVERSVSHV